MKLFVIVVKHAVFRSFGVVELAAAHCPEKKRPSAEADDKADRYEKKGACHALIIRFF